MILRLFFLLPLWLLTQLSLSAQCGAIDYNHQAPLRICTADPVTVPVSVFFADSSQTGLVVGYYLQTNDSFDPQNPAAVATYTDNTIAPPVDVVPGQSYYLFVAAGIDGGDGLPNPNNSSCYFYQEPPLEIIWAQLEPLVVTTTPSAPTLSCNPNILTELNVIVANAQPPLTYSWSNGESSSTTFATVAGTYTVTITAANGCTALTTILVSEATDVLPLSVDSVANISCENSVGQLFGSYDPTVNLLLLTTSSNGPGTFAYPAPGSFVYTTTEPEAGNLFWFYGEDQANICRSGQDTFAIQRTTDGCAFIGGNVFRDNDGDCQQNSNEGGLAQRLVKMTGSVERYARSDANGDYTLFAPADETITLEIVSDHLLYENCGQPLTLTAPALGQILTQNLGQQTLADCPLLTVQATTTPVRRCFSVGIYLDYCNHGTLGATDTYILLDLDPLYTVDLDSVANVTLAPDGRYRIETGDLAEGECGSFYLPTTLSCDAVLGQTLCIEAEILPEFNCLPTDPAYSGAVVEVSGECDNGVNRFEIRNTGTAAMPQAQQFIVIEDGVVLLHMPFDLGAGDSIALNYPGTGSTYRVEAEQVPNFPVPSMPSATVAGCSTNPLDSNSITDLFLQFGLDDLYPSVDLECNEVIGSYDPNDKQAYPRGYDAAHYIENETPLEYHIRFQNTGTDTAFTVVIEDALDPNLDVTTFRPLGSSHAYAVEFGIDDTVRFVFNDILLPDSFVNEPLSHGFIRFAIQLEQDLPLETVVKNKAGIYFDFNAPIITNEVFHTVGREFLVVNTSSPSFPQLRVTTYPNPARNDWHLRFDGLDDARELQLTLLDVQGRTVQTTPLSGSPATVPVGRLPEGLYFYRLKQRGRVLATGKLVRL